MRSTIVLNTAVKLVTDVLARTVVKLTECLHGLPQSSQADFGTVTQIASRPPSFIYFTIYYLLTLIKFDTLEYISCTPSVKVFRNAKVTNTSTLNKEVASYFDTWDSHIQDGITYSTTEYHIPKDTF